MTHKNDVGCWPCIHVKRAGGCNLTSKGPLFYQHDEFYREESLHDSHYSFVIVYDRDWSVRQLKCLTFNFTNLFKCNVHE